MSGFSNGGYGCMHIGLKYPKKYAYIGALSAGDKAESEYKQDGSLKSKYRERLLELEISAIRNIVSYIRPNF